MSHYRKGVKFEREVRSLLENHGYFVIRSAGSKGPVDLAALKGAIVFLIQCKAGCHIDGHTTKKLLELAEDSQICNVIPVYARKEGAETMFVNLRTHREVLL